MLLCICYVIHDIEIMFAVQTLEGIPFIALSCIYVVYYNKYNGRCPDPKGNLHAENVPEWVNSSARDRK